MKKGLLWGWLLCFYVSFAPAAEKMDYDGEPGAEILLRTPFTFRFTNYSADTIRQFGRHPADIPVAGDFDGDGRFDLAVRRPSNATWYVLNSSGTDVNSARKDGIQRQAFGRLATDIPAVGDYDGDGIDDFAVRRPANQTWYIRNSSGSNFNSTNNDGIQRIRFGLQEQDIPVPADYNGDGITDIAVRRPSTSYWYIKNSSGDRVNYNSSRQDGIQRVRFGLQADDIPVPADYDGDGIDDIAVRRPSTFYWYILSSKTGEIIRHVFGRHVDDIPMVADYDADGKADIAVRRPGNQHVYILRSSDNQIERHRIGITDDLPVAAPSYLLMQLVQETVVERDSDSDGLTDLEEIEVHGTDPFDADTDGDGFNDMYEVIHELDPLVADSLIDFSLIEEPQLRSCVEFSYGFSHSLPPEENSVNLINDLQCANYDISDLSGIEQFSSLTSLNLTGNNVSDITPIIGLTALTELVLTNNPIMDLSLLAQLPGLERLDLWRSPAQDFSVLSELTNLEYLYLAETSFENTALLSSLTKLLILNLNQTNVTDLSGLAPLVQLQELFLYRTTGVADASALNGLTDLVVLDISRTSASDIGVFRNHDNWKTIGFDGIPLTLTDLQFLINQTQLEKLYAEEVGVSDLNAVISLLENAPLTLLWFGKNQVADISGLPALQSLESLNLNSSLFTDTSVFYDLPSLKGLYLNNNPQILCSDYNELHIYFFTQYDQCKND